MFVVWHMRLDKEFFTHITNYQAQVNPNKVGEHFNNFKKAFYPHLENLERKRSEAIKQRLDREYAKGEIGFLPQLTKPVRRMAKVVDDVRKVDRFSPKPRTK